ncbi:MAG: hypothetical protein H6644_19360 [Caldilineaceae bacterium]|nr:hypothetical protein [Caldilineaceae bacterium]
MRGGGDERRRRDAHGAPAVARHVDRHYAPRATLHLFAGDPHVRLVAMQRAVAEALAAGRRVGVMAADESRTRILRRQPRRWALATAEVMAQRLYAAMRALDAQDVEPIFAHEAPASDSALASTTG